MTRSHVSTDTPWEQAVGYSRAIRVGDTIAVSGTTAPGENAYVQARNALQIIARALADAGASLDDVIRTRIYITDITQWESVARAHAECFAKIKPATTMVEVSRLISPEYLIEIEADAIVTRARSDA
jgi:enamine deaminase RidA (YjgF/YER057c/UK114 family)